MNIDQKQFSDQLAQLIATPSISCTNPTLDMGNRQVIDLLANWLNDYGFKIDIQVVDEQANKANLIATLEPQNPTAISGKGLVFAGHADTVPYDTQHWTHDPFTLNINNDRAYGLGATDMKGFFPTVIAAIQPFLQQPLIAPLVIIATADEETSMSGAKSLLKQSVAGAACAVIGEPTSMQPIRLHKGMAMESIKIQGQSGHSSDPSLGNNALDAMGDVLSTLTAFRNEMQQRYHHSGFIIPVPTLNLGCIHGGDNPNRICGHCELAFDIRPLPGMQLDELRASIDQQLIHIANDHNIDIQRHSLFAGINAFEQNSDSELIRLAEHLTGKTAGSVAFATEAPFLQEMGMDVVVMGPGSIDQAHQPNEFIDLSTIGASVDVLSHSIEQFCISEKK